MDELRSTPPHYEAYLPVYLLGELFCVILGLGAYRPRWIPDPTRVGRNLVRVVLGLLLIAGGAYLVA